MLTLTIMLAENSTVDNSSNVISADVTGAPANQICAILVFLSMAIFLATFGNGFTIYAFLRFEELRTPFNSFILNLAIADFFVGIIVMPCFAIYNYHGHWPLGEPLCSIWIFTDWFMTFESLVTLSVISVERLISVKYPVHYHRFNGPRNILVVILVTWIFVACIWIPGYALDRMRPGNVVEDCAWDPAKNYTAGICDGVLYVIPYVLMVVCYVYVGWKMFKRYRNITPKLQGRRSSFTTIGVTKTRHSMTFNAELTCNDGKTGRSYEETSQNQNQPRIKAVTILREKSALLTLGAVVMTFSLCWIPFYVYFFITLFNWMPLPDWFATLTYWTAYLNSAINPILYTALHRDFRKRFRETLAGLTGKKSMSPRNVIKKTDINIISRSVRVELN